MPESENALYGAFLSDLKEVNTEILPEDILRKKIADARNENLAEEERLSARNAIIASNLRLIPFMIRNASQTGIPPEELIGESFEVLDSCIDNFDLERISPKSEDNPKFSTYVASSLAMKLRSPRSVVRIDDVMHVPPHIDNIQVIMRKARELFMQEEEREPTHEEWYIRTVKLAGEEKSLSTVKSITPETFESTDRTKFKGKIQLRKKVGSGKTDRDTLATLYGDVEDLVLDDSLDVEEQAISSLMNEDVYEVLRTLGAGERVVIELHFGLGLNEDGKPKESLTFEQISEMMGVTRERVRKIEAKALRKLRHPSRTKIIKDYAEGYTNLHRDLVEKIHYKNMLARVASNLLSARSREEVVSFLQQMKRGSIKSGRFDTELLSMYFKNDEIENLLMLEKKMESSPRRFTLDLFKVIQEYMEGFRSGKLEFRDKKGRAIYEASYYWRHVPEINPDELNIPKDA